MATKVKPSRLQVTWTPQVWQVPVYVDEDTFQWWAGWGGGGWDVVWPASSTDWNIVLFDWNTGKAIKDSWVGLSSKLDATALSNNAYWGGWNGDTTHTPTKDALYDKIHTMDVEIWNKAADTSVVKLTWNQTIAWTKTFSTSPVVPSKTTDATNTWTAIATEAQVYKVDSKVSDLFGLWKFLSLWNATTWLPISFPLSTPYTYTTWDYFLVETVSSATPPVNYKPTGSSYSWTASTTTESEELEVWDIYIYDGTNWLLQLNHWKTVSFSEIAWNATDNTSLSNALAAKADDNSVVKLTGDQSIAGTKTFSVSPVVPSKTSDATNTGTAIATEAQVYKKQDTLTLPATPTNWHLVAWWSDNKTLTDWWAIPTGVPTVWTNGQVLTVVSGVAAWAAPSGWDVMVSSQANNILTSWMKIWAWTQTNYDNLWTYDSNTVYLTIE